MDTDSLGQRLYKRAEQLQGKRRYIFDVAWQQISQYFLPDLSDINTTKTEGVTGWFDRIYDSGPIRAASTCSIGVRNWVTPATEQWLSLGLPNNLPKLPQVGTARMKRLMAQAGDELDEEGRDDATRWCEGTAEQMSNDLSSSNFYSVVQPFNRGACVFGTALMYCEEGKNDQLYRFEQFKVGTFAIAENDQKLVDTVFRWFKLTVRQAVQRFCKADAAGQYDLSNMPKKIAECYLKQRYDEKFEFLHCVYPNEDYRKDAIGKDGMTVASVYISCEEKTVIQEGGYEEMPYFCLRWSRWGTDDQPYGCSPAFETLPEARQLNYVIENWDTLVELKAFPRLLYPDNLDGNVQLAAGSVTVYQSDKPNAKPEEWLTQGSEMSLQEMVDRKQKAIEDAFFVDIFKMFEQLEGNQPRTAYEIAQRLGEKLDKFTGTFDQYVTELINPLVRRLLGIALRAGRLIQAPPALLVQKDPKSPPELALPKVVVNSRVTLALKSLQNSGLQRTLQTWLPVIQATGRVDILDNIDVDAAIRRSGRNDGMSAKDFVPMEQLNQLRAQRAKQQEQQQALMAAESASKSAANLGKAPPGLQDAASGQLAGAAA